MNEPRPGLSHWLPPLALALALLLAGMAVGRGLEQFRTGDRSITVKGLAEKDVASDFATWDLQFRRAGNDFGEVQRALAEDRGKVTAFLRQHGFGDKDIEARPLQVQDLFAREYGGSSQPLRFQGVGVVIVSSAQPAKVAAAALATDPLIQAGVQLGGGGGGDGQGGPRYQLRGFNEIKAPLLAEATRNAREQAQKFASEAGATLGPLRKANQGVIQIGSADGQGADEGSARTKRLRVVSTFEYALQ
jgi:uncharacterized protein